MDHMLTSANRKLFCSVQPEEMVSISTATCACLEQFLDCKKEVKRMESRNECVKSSWARGTQGVKSSWARGTQGVKSSWARGTQGVKSSWARGTQGVKSSWARGTQGVKSSWARGTQGTHRLQSNFSDWLPQTGLRGCSQAIRQGTQRN